MKFQGQHGETRYANDLSVPICTRAPADFVWLYCRETELLMEAIGDADPVLAACVRDTAKRLRQLRDLLDRTEGAIHGKESPRPADSEKLVR